MGLQHPDKLSKKCVNFVSQNTRGFNNNKEEELIDRWKEHNAFAGCLQKNLARGKEMLEESRIFFHSQRACKKAMFQRYSRCGNCSWTRSAASMGKGWKSTNLYWSLYRCGTTAGARPERTPTDDCSCKHICSR